MNRRKPLFPLAWMACLAASLVLAYSPGALAADKPPEVTEDGLHLQKDTKTRVVYLRPGATFDQYKRVAILDCHVEFEKDWQRHFNQDQLGTQRRVSDQDMKRVTDGLAEEFKVIFTEELQDKGGYQVVNVAAPDVLVLRPAIYNLAVTAPDLMTADRSRTVVESAGQMTLFLELWDSASNTVLARVIDAKADRSGGGMAQMANRVTNKAAADRILRSWAGELRKALDAAQGKAPKD